MNMSISSSQKCCVVRHYVRRQPTASEGVDLYAARSRRFEALYRSRATCRFIQNSEDVLRARARRIAVSAVISRLPLTSVLTRWMGTLIRRANSTWLIPIGFRNSSSSMVPGWVGVRCLGIMLHRSEEHTSELQSRLHLVCRLLLEKKK